MGHSDLASRQRMQRLQTYVWDTLSLRVEHGVAMGHPAVRNLGFMQFS